MQPPQNYFSLGFDPQVYLEDLEPSHRDKYVPPRPKKRKRSPSDIGFRGRRSPQQSKPSRPPFTPLTLRRTKSSASDKVRI